MLRIFRLLALSAMASLVSAASASPAGVIPYACIDNDPYILMAFDPVTTRLGYATFGGAREGDETIAGTAAREFHEETRCVFDTPTAEELAAMKPSKSHGFYSYVAEIPFISQLAIPEHPCAARIERTDWLWVRLSDLEQGLESGESRPEVLVSLMHKYITLWDKSAASLRQAREDGLLDRTTLCRAEGTD